MINAANTIKLSVSEPVVHFVVVEVPKDEDRDPSRQEVREACQTVRQALNAWYYEAQ